MATRLRRHPNLGHIEDASGIRHDPPFFTMQLIEGGSLEDPANRNRFRAPDQAMNLMIQIAKGVHSAHSDNVVHRDLKPGNVLVDTAGHPYVADFGVATLIRPGADDATGAVVGTLGYMSPEHVHGRANPQVDVGLQDQPRILDAQRDPMQVPAPPASAPAPLDKDRARPQQIP